MTSDAITQAIKYRKTALIEATQWWQMGDHPAVVELPSGGHWIETLEGGHFVSVGDWIATGVHGEHWPIKPDIFAKTYEPVDNTRSTSLAAQDGLVDALEYIKAESSAAVSSDGKEFDRYAFKRIEDVARKALSAIKGDKK